MQARFTQREDGQVDAELVGDWPLFNEALADSISSLPPRGAAGKGPSTYWIDVAREGLLRAVRDHDERPFTCGNVTMLRVRSGQVEARYDFAEESEPGEFLALDDFLRLLENWRERVVTSAAMATTELPATYRRNPTV